MVTHVLAHQGGWDEILMVAAPIVLIAALLVTANRRADRERETQLHDAEPGGPAHDD